MHKNINTLPGEVKDKILSYLYFSDFIKKREIINNIINNYHSIFLQELKKLYDNDEIYKCLVRWVINYYDMKYYDRIFNGIVTDSFTKLDNSLQDNIIENYMKKMDIIDIQRFYMYSIGNLSSFHLSSQTSCF